MSREPPKRSRSMFLTLDEARTILRECAVEVLTEQNGKADPEDVQAIVDAMEAWITGPLVSR